MKLKGAMTKMKILLEAQQQIWAGRWKNQLIWRQFDWDYSVQETGRKDNNEYGLRDLWDTIKHINICIIRVLKQEEIGQEKNLKKSWSKASQICEKC